MAGVELILDLLAQYEPQMFWEDPSVEPDVYHLEQDVISQYLFEQGPGTWAVFDPRLVQHGGGMAVQVLKLKIVHVCASSITHETKLRMMHSFRRSYYSAAATCVSQGQLGPQHPCCILFGKRHSIFNPEVPELPPYIVGSIYGPPMGNSSWLSHPGLLFRRFFGLRQYSIWTYECGALHEELK